MANLLRGGFKPVEGTKFRARRYTVASGYGTAIYPGDIVKAVTTGVVEAAAAGDTDLLGAVAYCQRVVDGRRQDVKYIPASSTYSPTDVFSSTATWVWVWDHPDIEYIASVSSHANTDTRTKVYAARFSNMDLVAGAGSTVYGQSGYTLDGNPIAGTAQFRILDILRDPANDTASANYKVVCQINEGFHASTDTAGI